MVRRNWLLAIALFLSGANLIGLLFPFSLLVFALLIAASAWRPLAAAPLQLLLLGCVLLATESGLIQAMEFSDIATNLRQTGVGILALLMVGFLQRHSEEVLDKYFQVFSLTTLAGLVFYLLMPDAYFLSYSISDRSYLIGPSSRLLDNGVLAFAAIGPYRFQGLFDEPGTYSVFSAAAAFWAAQRGRRWTFLMLLVATVLSEGVVGLLVLLALFGWRGFSRMSAVGRTACVIAGVACSAILVSVDVEALGQALQVANLLENKTLSGQTRAEQLADVLDQWQSLILPAGFSVTAVLRVSADSITAGYLRGLIPYGLLLSALMLAVLLVALRQMDLRAPSSILFLALVVAGTSRIGVFDLFIGWFVLFCVLQKRQRLERGGAASPAVEPPRPEHTPRPARQARQ